MSYARQVRRSLASSEIGEQCVTSPRVMTYQRLLWHNSRPSKPAGAMGASAIAITHSFQTKGPRHGNCQCSGDSATCSDILVQLLYCRYVPTNLQKAKTGGLIPCEPIKRGLVPGGKSANMQKRGFVPAHDFANRRENELVKSFSRAMSRRLSVYPDKSRMDISRLKSVGMKRKGRGKKIRLHCTAPYEPGIEAGR